MKKAGSIFLLIIFLLNICGFYVGFSVLLYNNKQKISVLMNSKDAIDRIIVLKIRESTISDHSVIEYCSTNEIRHENRMYDVISKTISNGYVYFYCIHDNMDEKFYKELDDCVSNTTDTSSRSATNHHQLLKQVIKDYFANTIIYTYLVKSLNFSYTSSPDLYKHLFNNSVFLPPQLA